MTGQQYVILSKTAGDGSELPAIGTRQEVLATLSRHNTMPERDGDDLLYGPGICIQLPPHTDPIRQLLVTVVEEEIAWKVISRMMARLDWKLLDPLTGRELNA